MARSGRCATAPPASGFWGGFNKVEAPFRPGTRYIKPDLGYEVPYRPAIGVSFPDARARGSNLEDGLRTRAPSTEMMTVEFLSLSRRQYGLPWHWKPGIKHIDRGSGSLSEKPFKPCVRIVPGPEDKKVHEWKSSVHCVGHVGESAGDSKWKSSRHRPSIFSGWYLDESATPEWTTTKKPGKYTHQPEWIPPFREYEGKIPRRFYSIVPGDAAAATAAAGAAAGAAGATKRGGPVGKRKSKLYNQFATTFDKSLHYDESKRPLGGIKPTYKPSSDVLWPFTPEQTPRSKKTFDSHACHKEGVGTLMNHEENVEIDSQVYN